MEARVKAAIQTLLTPSVRIVRVLLVPATMEGQVLVKRSDEIGGRFFFLLHLR